MAHHQAHRIQDSDAQLLDTIQELKTQTPAGSSPLRALGALSHGAEEAFSREPSKEKPVGLSILGFPWQFIVAMGTIAIGVVALLGKMMGVF